MSVIKYAKSPADFPNKNHFLLVVFEQNSIVIPGDERSRTHPGHGYPEYTQTNETFKAYPFEDRAELEKALQKLYLEDKNRKDVAVLEVAGVVPVSVSLAISFSK